MVVSETPVGELMEHDFLGRFSGNISLSNGTSEEVVLFSRSECSKRKVFVFHFFKAFFDTNFRLFSVNGTDLHNW